MLAVLSYTTNPPIDVFSLFVPSTCEKRAPFRAERRVHRNVEEEDTVLPCYGANFALLDAVSARRMLRERESEEPHTQKVCVLSYEMHKLLPVCQFASHISLVRTISFLTQTDRCFRRLA